MAKNDDRDPDIGRLAAEVEKATQLAKKYRRLDHWLPYVKQAAFFVLGVRCRERAFFAGTQSGKTEAAAFEMACHLTGLYPVWWKGRRFDKPVSAWAVGDSLKMCRDILQKKLCGEAGSKEQYGAGFIPKHLLVEDGIVLARGEGLAYDSIQVRHVSGGISTLRFRTYSAGREALQGVSLDVIWLDEEPPSLEIYMECLARITATRGMLLITFTPLRGMSAVALRFLNEPSPDRGYIVMSLDDIPDANSSGNSGQGDGIQHIGHISSADRAQIEAGYSANEREARISGRPAMGSGLVYQTPESLIIENVDPLSFPTHWRWGWGIDLGFDHPFAAVLLCHDVDRDWIHVVAEHRVSGEIPDRHAKAMKAIEENIFGRPMEIPVAYPHDAGVHDKTSGAQMKTIYARWLKMMPEPASLPGLKGVEGRSLEGSIAEIDSREHGQAWYVSSRCPLYLEERRMFHWSAGKIVALHDDVLSAARYAFMMRRYFRSRIDIGGGAVGTAAYSQWVRKQATPARRVRSYDIFNPTGGALPF